jgi:protein-glutamine gamma-glutamyltransferase
LGINQSIKEGQKVKIAPLLVVLEDRMRGNVVSATRSFNATFGLPVTPFQGAGSAEVDRFFGSGSVPQCDCTAAAYIVLAKGLLDTIGATDFDALGYRSQAYPIKRRQPITTAQMKLGDWTYFKNYSDYLQVAGGAWQGENVIKVGSDQYWGHGGGVRSQSDWYSLLQGYYNSESGRNRTGPIPGFTGHPDFVDVARVGMGTFDVRKKRKQGTP